MKVIKFISNDSAKQFIQAAELAANFGQPSSTSNFGQPIEKDSLFFVDWDSMYDNLGDNGRQFADLTIETILRGNEDIMNLEEVEDNFFDVEQQPQE